MEEVHVLMLEELSEKLSRLQLTDAVIMGQLSRIPKKSQVKEASAAS